jgi:hypothetical protein
VSEWSDIGAIFYADLRRGFKVSKLAYCFNCLTPLPKRWLRICRFSVVLSIAAKIPRSYLSRAGACFILTASVQNLVTSADAHDWYPEECCRAKDCAPVESWAFAHAVQRGSLPQLSVTTKHGTAIVPRDLPRRESKDNRMHACMRGWGSVKQIVCIFLPPGT